MAVMLGFEDEYYKKRKQYRDLDHEQRIKAEQAMVSTTASTFDNIANTIGQSSEAAFNAQKAFLIPAAIMEGTMAAIAGFRSVMQTVPFPANVILAPTYAASIAAATAAQVANIAKQRYGGGASKPTAAKATNFSGGSLGSGGSGGGGTTVINNIIVEGQTIQTSVVRANERAAQNGSPAFAMEQ